MLHVSVQTWKQLSILLTLDLGLNLVLIFVNLSQMGTNYYHYILHSLCSIWTSSILLTSYASLFLKEFKATRGDILFPLPVIFSLQFPDNMLFNSAKNLQNYIVIQLI